MTARALSTRRLVRVKGRGSRWHAELTDAGHHYLEHGEYPSGHFGSATEPEPEREQTPTGQRPGGTAKAARSTKVVAKPEVDMAIDSPAGKRRRGGRPAGDELFTQASPDPCDEKILITVKEAAWILSLPEYAIRQAVSFGDLDRVFIGEGTKN